jgi:small subunit ribosomal protein S6
MVSESVAMETLSTEDKQLRDYEMVLIFNPGIVNEDLDTAINNVSQFVTERDGVISEVEQWGKKKLSYPIRHYMEGSYVLIRFKFKPTLAKEFEAKLGISEEVLRHLLIRL